MKTKTIYLARHGETDYNKNNKVQGRGINASLNETGQAQARLLQAYFKDKVIDSVYCSSLTRTVETVGDAFGPIHQLDGFDEISWGHQEGVVQVRDKPTPYWDTLDKWRNGYLNETIGGGESPIQVMTRQKVAMDIVMSGNHSNILICMHGRAMRILLSWLLNYPLEHMDGFAHQNCAIYELKYTGGFFRLHQYNYTGHLK